MTAPPAQPRDNGNEASARIESATRRAERARDRFDRELDGLIEDLRAAREAVREDDPPRDDDGGERGRGTA